jgi:hypothetical protein
MQMKYSDSIDYLFATIMYLGTHTYWWARSPKAMAAELQLDEKKLQEVFDGFSGIFRKSERMSPETGQHFYSLQARYAQRDGGDVSDPDQQSYIRPLGPDHLKVIIDFVLKMAEQEVKQIDQQQSRVNNLRTNFVAAGAAMIAAIAAILAAVLRTVSWRKRLVCSRSGGRQVDMVARVKCARRPLLPPLPSTPVTPEWALHQRAFFGHRSGRVADHLEGSWGFGLARPGNPSANF